MTLLFLAALAGGVVLFVLFPVFARHEEVSQLPTARAQERKSLTEQKERLYEAIKDVDFEYRAGKLSEADYQSVRSKLVSQAAAVVSKLDETVDATEKEPPPKEVPGEVATEDVTAAEGPTCPSCERLNPPNAKFCLQCGARMAASANCPECGTELPKEARFCTSCGVAVPA